MCVDLTPEIWQARRSGGKLLRPHDIRDAYDRDRARIIHSAAFRRLQAKTQVLGITEGDFHRTRLTHSMEVAQISRGLSRFIHNKRPELDYAMPPVELVEAVALAHDLGHPPFGHGGEVALNSMTYRHGGFEANGQALRILARMEAHTAGFGLDLTRRMLLGILKYPVPYSKASRTQHPKPPVNYVRLKSAEWQPPKSFLDIDQEVADWLLEPFPAPERELFGSMRMTPPDQHNLALYKGLDASLVEVADNIAYGTHDLEDGIVLRLISRENWHEVRGYLDTGWARCFGLENLADKLFDTGPQASHNLKQAIGGMVNAFISSAAVVENTAFQNPLLRYNIALLPAAAHFLEALIDFVYKNVICSHGVETMTYRGQYMMLMLFDALAADPKRLLPANFTRHLAANADEGAVRRMVCDYMAGMTDGYATRLYERLFVPRHGTVFERL